LAHQLLGQQDHEEFAVQPRPGTLRIGLRQVAELRQRLKPLEHQFHLPANPIPLQNLTHRKPARGKRGEYHDVLHVLPGLGLDFPAFA
jgi:hypothetical protein